RPHVLGNRPGDGQRADDRTAFQPRTRRALSEAATRTWRPRGRHSATGGRARVEPGRTRRNPATGRHGQLAVPAAVASARGVERAHRLARTWRAGRGYRPRHLARRDLRG